MWIWLALTASATPLIPGDEDTRITVLDDRRANAYAQVVAGIGDANGDGYADIVVGDKNHEINNQLFGAAFVYYGSATGIVNNVQLELSASDGQPQDGFGTSVAGGDFNGDGFADVAVSSPRADGFQQGYGAIYLYYGSAQGIDPSTEQIVWATTLVGSASNLGESLRNAGDVNADGYDDLVAGADSDNGISNNAGAAFLWLGSASGIDASSELRIENLGRNPGRFGRGVDGAGDFDGDGYDDIVIGAYGSALPGFSAAGLAYVYFGGPTGVDLTSELILQAPVLSTGMSFGYTVAGVGDVDNDGKDDIAVQARREPVDGVNNAGAVHVFYASVGTRTVGFVQSLQSTLPDGSGHWGEALDGCDIDANGYSDLLVGGADYSNTGITEVFPGSVNRLVDAERITSSEDGAGMRFGWALSCVGDVDGDSDMDIAITAPGWNGQGAVYIFGGCTDADGDGICIEDDCDDDDATIGQPDTERFIDADGDGFGVDLITAFACPNDPAYSDVSGDCDDGNPLVGPGFAEVCNELDDDCNGLADDGLPTQLWYLDRDGDGAGDPDETVDACRAPDDGVTTSDDCDDADPNRAPQHTEVCDGVDEDCDGLVDQGTSCFDDDGDGYTEQGGDCADNNAMLRPGVPEICDGLDQDCNGVPDDGTVCGDDDGDGTTEDEGDCHDGNATIGPHATEIDGDGIDNDCDGVFGGGAIDADGDGFTAEGGDCDEEDPDVRPGAIELEDGVDNDCDSTVDEGTAAYDDDGDGHSENEGDCNDDDADVHPDASELLAGVDDNCNGVVDEGGPWSDDDGDGWTDSAGDCDDADADIYPTAEEIEDGVDQDCDGRIDEGLIDLDGDGVTEADGDCDDSDPWVRPGGVEFCDDADNDCNGQVDDTCEGILIAPPAASGCQCNSGPGGLPFGAVLLAMLGLLRRRRLGLAAVALGAGGCQRDVVLFAIDSSISVAPELSDIGSVPVGGEATLSLGVQHVSGEEVELLSVEVANLNGTFFEHSGELGTVAPDAPATVDLVYRPTAVGLHRALVTVVSNAGDTPEITVQVRGRAVGPAVTVWPAALDFGSVQPGSSGTEQLTVFNEGLSTWTLSDMELDEPFRVVTALPITLEPGTDMKVDLAFEPTDVEAVRAEAVLVGEVDVPGLIVGLGGNDCVGGNPAAYDRDGDGVTACAGDCDDADAAVGPGAAEIADAIDNNCNGTVDEGTTAYDDDGDGFSEDDGDCQDADAALSPDAAEVADNGIDDDCDGMVDGGRSDADGDGFATFAGDCDDDDPDIRPGAPESANGIDDDCDGRIDEGTDWYDDDGDGLTEEEGDCDDRTNGGETRAPGLAETPDGIDNDCDLTVDEGTEAYDDDGDGYTEDGGDCDDALAFVHPFAREILGNGVDEDCDGVPD